MRYDEYKDLVIKAFPTADIDSMSPVELVKTIALELFITKGSDPKLAQETLRQIQFINAYGITKFGE